jgi:3-hydroxy acid dehydrogenase / malonic semialdehyde reductase
LLPLMLAKNSGHIVNIGSVAGRWIYGGGAVYCASKFAVRAISEALRLDLLGTAMRVSNIEPGMVNTEFSTVRFGDKAKADSVYAGMKPLTANDIAETIAWVINRPQHVNIQELVIFPTDQAAIRDVHRS